MLGSRIGVVARCCLVLCSLIASDLIAARILVRIDPQIDVPPRERARLAKLDHEAGERKYRVRSDVYDHDLLPRFDGRGWWGPTPYHVTTNSLGFRDDSTRNVVLADSRPRVLLLGDSFTEGIGLDFADSFAGRIARRLRPDVDVLNAAVTSYSPAIYYAKTRHLLDDLGLRCTQVVVFIDISDAEDEARTYELRDDGRVGRQLGLSKQDVSDGIDARLEEVPATLLVRSEAPRTIAVPPLPQERPVAPPEHGRLVTALKRRSIVVRTWLWITEPAPAPVPAPSYPQANPHRGLWTVDERDYEEFGRRGLSLGAQHMDRLAELLAAHGIRLTIAVYPWPDQLRYDNADSIQVRFWRRWAGRHGAAFVDLFEPFFHEPDREKTIRQDYIAGDVHFNSQGSAVVANRFLEQFSTAPTATAAPTVRSRT